MRFDYEVAGICTACRYDLFRGSVWLPEFWIDGVASNLYHVHNGSLFCTDNMRGTKAILHTVPDLDPEPFCTLVVTHLDGSVSEYPNTRFAISRDEIDPIVINGTTVTIENDEQTVTILSVRSFKMEHPV